MNFDKTMSFKNPKEEVSDAKEIVKEVYEALQEKGYNPINQLVGYILSFPSFIIVSNPCAVILSASDIAKPVLFSP